jgi:hypothetical protein
MSYIFDNSYTLNSKTCRELGELYALHDKSTGALIGYRATTRRLVNQQEICSASFPCSSVDLSDDEIAKAKVRTIMR